MPRFPRGCVVVRAGRYAVVWHDAATGLVLLPLMAPRTPCIHDVLLDLPDLIACEAPIAHAVIRPRLRCPTPREGYAAVGTVPGPVMCRVVQGMVRLALEQATVARWSGDREHRNRAKILCEKLA